MKSNKLNIIYRVCDSVENYNSIRTTGSKLDVIEKSIISLKNAIDYVKKNYYKESEISIDVVCDRCSNRNNLISKIENSFFKDNLTIHKTLENSLDGNMESLALSFDIASKKKGYIFFLEDDYLLSKNSLMEILSFLNAWTDDSHICIKPHVDLWMFSRDLLDIGKFRQREVFAHSLTYWMRDISSTCTFLIDDFIFHECLDLFEKTKNMLRVDEKYLNEIFKRFPLFAPLNQLGVHFHSEVNFPPFFLGQPFYLKNDFNTKDLKC